MKKKLGKKLALALLGGAALLISNFVEEKKADEDFDERFERKWAEKQKEKEAIDVDYEET